MPRKKPEPKPIQIDSIKHADESRTNIPTKELRDFVADDEQEPKMKHYPRNPDLDPQLVWRGKDEQDSNDLEVPVVPVYIQEKVHPQAIIQDIKRYAKQDQPATVDLFGSDFNDLEFDQLIEFYQHQQKWQNRMILGDSLQVMASLAEKEGLKGQVQMIYIDPPYGIKFGSNWQVSTRKRDVKDGKAEDVTRQPEQIRAFRDTWELGIHSYLAYLRDRLVVARELLTESGSVFVQIGDDNVHRVRCLMDEVFGDENFIALTPFRKKTMPLGAKYLESMFDYLLWYAKDANNVKYRQLYLEQDITGDFHWGLFETPDFKRSKMTQEQIKNMTLLPSGSKIFRLVPLWPASFSAKDVYPVNFKGKIYTPPKQLCWVTGQAGINRLIYANRIQPEGTGNLRYVYFFDDYKLKKMVSMWDDTTGARGKNYVVETSTKVIQRCLLMTTDPGDIVLDPTCGSGTTAYVAEQWGIRWITCDTSRVALALARTRLMTAKYPYYQLKDSKAGIKQGFVYKTVPHITLKAIANNKEIDTIHAKWQEKLEPIQQELNKLLNQQWQEWEIPREPEKAWTKKAKDLLAQWWDLRQQRQKEIDESIAKHSNTETLYDQPYEDKKRVRVTGPFTVESLSPHRMLTTDASVEEIKAQMQPEVKAKADSFETLILDNLKKSGVQNTVKNERLEFDRLEPYAGNWIHAEGEYTDKQGQTKQVAVSIGPEHGTVSPLHIKEATKEAIKNFDVLVICGFAFDPHVSEEAKHYGKKLVVLLTKMNPDLTLGEDLLKKTGSANLFMVFGEPDIQPVDAETGQLKPLKNGQYQIEILGVDIYDPTKGIVKSHSTDDIACWFIDTNYNNESFFVRHVYFTGAGEPYKKLKRALKAEIDEAAWSEIYSTKSRPFDKPATGKIAVKVINHYGDEVLKVFEV